MQSSRRIGAGGRLAAWIVTGPIGRLVAFVGDLGAAVGRGAMAKVRRL